MKDEKLLVILVIVIVALIAGSFLGGFFIAKSRSNTKIAEAQDTIDRLGKQVEGVNSDLESARTEIRNLRELQSADRDTIERLAQSNRRASELIGEQRELINELREQNTGIGNESSSITSGLGNAVESVDSIIQILSTRED